MTATQKQCLLAYFGFIDPKEIDGIWGPKSAEATKKLQAQLGLEDDGVWGNATDRAAKEALANGFVPTIEPTVDNSGGSSIATDAAGDAYIVYAAQYLQADGYYHIPRGVDVQLSKNLWAHEIHCQGKGCCTESIISKRAVDTFQRIRDDYGGPIYITTAGGSGYRCLIHNPEVGGAIGSLHTTGDAMDLHATDKGKLQAAVNKNVTDGEIGVYSWGIHFGVWNRGYVNRFTK